MAQVMSQSITSILVAALLIYSVNGANDVTAGDLTAVSSLEEMQLVFARTETEHAKSMASIMKTMSSEVAWHVLEKNNLTTAAFMEAASLAKQLHLRKQPKGYAGLEGARKLLNDMIFESMSKYDAEIAKCTECYAQQCDGMEACRGQIAASNFIAANSRTMILDAQSRINRCEVDIPTRKLELKLHNEKCAHELQKMKTRLEIILGDIQEMTISLTMTDSDAKKFIQKQKLALLRCDTLETQIRNDEDMLADSQTKLGQATEKEATAGETARQTAAENEQMDSDLRKQMKTCTDNYIGFETELCDDRFEGEPDVAIQSDIDEDDLFYYDQSDEGALSVPSSAAPASQTGAHSAHIDYYDQSDEGALSVPSSAAPASQTGAHSAHIDKQPNSGVIGSAASVAGARARTKRGKRGGKQRRLWKGRLPDACCTFEEFEEGEVRPACKVTCLITIKRMHVMFFTLPVVTAAEEAAVAAPAHIDIPPNSLIMSSTNSSNSTAKGRRRLRRQLHRAAAQAVCGTGTASSACNDTLAKFIDFLINPQTEFEGANLQDNHFNLTASSSVAAPCRAVDITTQT